MQASEKAQQKGVLSEVTGLAKSAGGDICLPPKDISDDIMEGFVKPKKSKAYRHSRAFKKPIK